MISLRPCSVCGAESPVYESDFVDIVAADFNGESWDGSPFEPTPIPRWLSNAIHSNLITVSSRGSDRDYAVFEVKTPNGIVIALPGDRIVRNTRNANAINVIERKEKYRDEVRFSTNEKINTQDDPTRHDIVTFTVTCKMKRRWAKQFTSMLKEMERLGINGSSRNVTFMSDGDGDFRPKFLVVGDDVEEKLTINYDGRGNSFFDAG